jgi:tetratricopeptide (TPR) repeat protein
MTTTVKPPAARPGAGGACRQANIEALAGHRPELLQRIMPPRQEEADVAPVTGGEPWPGVADHLQTVPPDARGLVVFLGMGVGHGPLLLLRERPEVAQIVILEPSFALFDAAMASVDLQPLITSKRVFFFVGEINWQELENVVTRVASLEDTHILRHLPSFRWRPQLYGPVNDRAYMLLNQINASGSTTRTCGPVFMENRFAAFTLLRHARTLDALRDRFRGRPAVLVAAGPSLTRSLPELQKVAGHCVLIAADSALAPLLKAGIMPDFVTSIDYLDLNFEKLAPFTGQEWPFSLVALIKGTPLVPARFPARHIFFAFADDQPQKWMMHALGVRTMSVLSASVAHLSLGLAMVLGCGPIIFTGQDLSYTNAVGDHADGTVIMRDDLPNDREFFRCPAVGGGTVITDRQLLSLLKIFEDIIAAAPGQYINATAAGLRIRGTTEMTLAEAVARHCRTAVPAGAIVDSAFAASPAPDVENFVRAAGANLEAVRETGKQLRTVIGLTQRLAGDIGGLAGFEGKYARFEALPGRLRKELARFDQLNGAIDNSAATWVQVVELTFAMLSENDQRRDRNERLRAQAGYLPWLRAEIERIQALNIDRLQVLEDYAARLDRLLTWLAREKSLLAGTDAAASREMIRLHLQAGNYVLAGRMLAGLPAPEENDAGCFLPAGEIRAGRLDFAGALAAWRQALAMDPSLAERITALKGRCSAEWLGFVERYGNAGEGGDNFPHLLPVWLGRVAEILADAPELPERLLSVWEMHRGRIEAWLAEGRLDLAELTVNGWQPCSGRLPEVLVLRARLLAARGEYGAAADITQQAAAAAPGRADWLALLARLLLKAHRFAEAVDVLGRAAQLDGQHAVIWEEIGDILFAAQDYDGALLAYEKCFLALPAHVDALRKMGDCCLAGRQPAAAIAAYEAALERSPGDAGALLGLSRAREQ